MMNMSTLDALAIDINISACDAADSATCPVTRLVLSVLSAAAHAVHLTTFPNASSWWLGKPFPTHRS